MSFHKNLSFPFVNHRFSAAHLSALPTLASSRLIAFTGSAITGLFFSIFLYEFFDYSITLTLLWYLIAYAVRIPTCALAAKVFSKTGLVPSMVIGTMGVILFYIAIYVLDVAMDFQPFTMLALAIVGLTVLTGFYWVPFHVDFAEFSTKGRRGRQLSLYYTAQRMIGVMAPIVGGFLIMRYGYSVIFLFAIATSLMSLIPMAYLPRTYVMYEYGFFETFQKLFSREYRTLTLPMMAHGAENMVGMIIWPIFLFSVFDGAYLSVGIFAAVIVIVSILFQTLVGRQIDSHPVKKMLSWGTQIYALGWFLKAMVDTVIGVFAASTFHSFGSIMMRTSMDAIYYEKAADSGHYVDEFTVIKETAINIGRMLMVVVLILVTAVMSLQGAFVIAAIVSLGISILNNFHSKEV